MNFRILLFFFFASLVFYNSQGQVIDQQNYINARKYVVAIGTVKNVQLHDIRGATIHKRNFIEIGSGLISYILADSNTVKIVVTARHVVNFFLQNHLDTIFIRPSWADTMKTTDYFGIPVPKALGPLPTFYVFPDLNIDLASILVPGSSYDSMTIVNESKDGNNSVFPYQDMSVPELGDQVWIYGYPEHIENSLESQFLYYFATLKPGYIAWTPPAKFSNSDLNHITIVESNATHGNSGGPVFSFNVLLRKIQLIGILVDGYQEVNDIVLNGKPLEDTATHKKAYAIARSGVSIIENAEYVKKMIEYTQKVFNDYRKKYHF